tara:strand:+ start:254 stop:478 length:225 start_codon:yes stop_codon:yes gene_type:complete
MKHWKTNEDMGEGFHYDEKHHKMNEYNSLIHVDTHEETTMRTKYLIRDIWDIQQLEELQRHLQDVIESRWESSL